mgnify:CR=1 FL=1
MSANNGKPCKNCGGQDWNNDGKCRKCKADHDRRYRINNTEKVAESKRNYREKNPEKLRLSYMRWLENNRDKKAESDRQWATANQDKIKANHLRWRSKEENKAKIAARSKDWREINSEKERESRRLWSIKNHDHCIAKTHKRRAKMRGGGNYTAKEWRDLLDKCGNKCLCCGRSDVKLTVDHIIPISKGGSNTIDNLQPLCLSCNDKKGAKTIWFRYSENIATWQTIRI